MATSRLDCAWREFSFFVRLARSTLSVAAIDLEAESATLSGGASKATNHSGYSDSGFVDGFYYSTTAQVSFAVNALTVGSYSLTLRYSAGNGTSSNTGLQFNGSRIKGITFGATSSWDVWSNETETVSLKAGSNTVAYKAEISSGSCINLDKLSVLSTAAKANGSPCASAGECASGSCVSGRCS